MGERERAHMGIKHPFPSISFILPFLLHSFTSIAASTQIAECAEHNGPGGLHNQNAGKFNGQQNVLERFQCTILTAHKALDLGFYAFQFGKIIAGVQTSNTI